MSSVVDKQEIIDMIRLKSPRLELVSFDAGKSEAWRWFKRVRVDGHVLPYAVCNGCFKPVHYTPRDGTGGLRRHACALTVAMSQAKEKDALKNGQHKAGASASATHSPLQSRASSGPHDRNSLDRPSLDRKKSSGPPASPSSYGRRSSLTEAADHLLSSSSGAQAANGSPAGQFRSQRNNRRSATSNSNANVPISLTLWAAEKGLVDLNAGANAAAHPPGLPAGLSIASAFAALQGIQSLVPPSALNARSPFNHALSTLANPFAVNLQQQQHHQSPSAGSPSPDAEDDDREGALDLALDLAVRKSAPPHNNNNNKNGDDRTHHSEQQDRFPLQQVQADNEHRHQRDQSDHKDRDRAQSIVDHILKNINQSSKFSLDGQKSLSLDEESTGKKLLVHDSNQNVDQNVQQQPSGNSRFSIVPQCRSGRRPRKRSNPDRAIPTSSVQQLHHDEDIEANLQMLAQVANEPTVKRERLSPDPLHNGSSYNHLDHSSRLQRSLALYKMNGGQLTPNSQRSLPSPDVHDEMSSGKSERSSPAQFVPVASDQHENTYHLRDSSQLKQVENFVQSLSHVLKSSPQCSLAEGAQLLQLGDLHMCLNSLLDVHKLYLKSFESRMPVPEIQKPAPVFKGLAVVDGQFKEISLEDYKGKYVILFFYPLDFTFVCPTEIIAFSERADEFRKINCELIACSTDSHFCHLAWVNTPRKQGGLGSLNIPLLADKSAAISKSYGVYKEDEGLTFRGLFIIDEQQRLRQITVNDLPVGRSVDETLRLVQAFQFTDKHGEVCPAGWTPGKKSMKADPVGSKEYFETAN